jgi:sulfhydrogenase subunit beta (sulfur reductase)
MKIDKIKEFLSQALEKYLVFAPCKIGDDVVVKQIENDEDLAIIDYSGAMPKNGFKFVFLPPRQELATFHDDQVAELESSIKPTIVFGVNIVDLEAFGLFELVFAKDSYYQKNRGNLFVIGFSAGIEDDYRKYQIFHQNYEENILEHRAFDVFFEVQKDNDIKIFTGSQKGQTLLNDFGVKDYSHIEFAGYIREEGPSPRLNELLEKVKNGADNKIWDELNAKCLACGRCTIACPTCFCYDIYDEPKQTEIVKYRQWGSCFYNNFTAIAGGHEYLDTVKKKIYFWYFHKFVRIPEEFKYPGCVSCGRCAKVCPVGIDIRKVLESLGKSEKG